jgi:hypothetical protein
MLYKDVIKFDKGIVAPRSMSTTAGSFFDRKGKCITNYTFYKNKPLENFQFENENQQPEKTVKTKITEREFKLQQAKKASSQIRSAKLNSNTFTNNENTLLKMYKTVYSPILSEMLVKKKEFEKFGQSIDKRREMHKVSNDNCFDISMIKYKITSHQRNPFKKRYIKLQAKDYESSEDSIEIVTNKISQRISFDKTSNESRSNSTYKKKPIFQSNTFKEKGTRKESIPNSTREFILKRQRTMDFRKKSNKEISDKEMINQTYRESFHMLSTYGENAQTVYTPPEPIVIPVPKTSGKPPTYRPKIKSGFNKTAFLDKYGKILDKVEREKEGIL